MILSWARIIVASLKLLSAVKLSVELLTWFVKESSGVTQCTSTEFSEYDLKLTSKAGKAQAQSSIRGQTSGPLAFKFELSRFV